MTEPSRVALGFRAHSGWAAAVAVSESGGGLSVLLRSRIELADPAVPGFPQPYHAAEPLPLPEARDRIEACVAASRCLAEGAIRLLLHRFHPCACGLLTSSAKPLPALESILASHALIHTAEGEMFREALIHGASECRLPTRKVRERDAYTEAAGITGLSEIAVRARIAELGASLGAPWREDQKLATLAAWIALHAKGA